LVHEYVAGPAADNSTSDGSKSDNPVLGSAASQFLTEAAFSLLQEVARFAAAPLSVLAARSTLEALLEAYLGRRSAAQVLAGRLRRETGETIRAVLLYGDLRGFTELRRQWHRKRLSARSARGSTVLPAVAFRAAES
jgi:class 3 adenylate cyclase